MSPFSNRKPLPRPSSWFFPRAAQTITVSKVYIYSTGNQLSRSVSELRTLDTQRSSGVCKQPHRGNSFQLFPSCSVLYLSKTILYICYSLLTSSVLHVCICVSDVCICVYAYMCAVYPCVCLPMWNICSCVCVCFWKTCLLCVSVCACAVCVFLYNFTKSEDSYNHPQHNQDVELLFQHGSPSFKTSVFTVSTLSSSVLKMNYIGCTYKPSGWSD